MEIIGRTVPDAAKVMNVSEPLVYQAKRNAVTALLMLPSWVTRSDREIARHVGVSISTAILIRRELVSSERIDHQHIRTFTRKGKEVTMDTSKINEGRKGKRAHSSSSIASLIFASARR
ncbi:MAG: hypothetical protein RBU30_14820 [Polyangia bacterium]|nr:hypothetical protein [Polyangia bacterium]